MDAMGLPPSPPSHLRLSATAEAASCRVCGSTTDLRRCSSCKTAFYCSQTHQQCDWRNHRLECKQIRSRLDASSNKAAGFQSSVVPDHSGRFAESVAHHATAAQSYSAAGWQQRQQPALGPTAAQTAGQQAYLPDTLNGHSDADRGCSRMVGGGDEPASTFEAAAARMQADREKKERDFRNLSENTMRINDASLLNPNMMASDLRDDLCKTIIADMNAYGLSVIDDFLGRAKGLDILREVDNMYGAGVFRNGQLVSNSIDERNLKTIRGDKITWVKGTEPGCTNIGSLINQIDNLVISANKMRDNGCLGKYKIRERTKAMVACYPGSGAQYVMHVDNPNQDGRVITAIYYLNLDWDTQRSGGMLRIIPENGSSAANIEPKFDRILFFWSDRRNPHEVQPAHHTRYAITVWYFDADEREAALQRFRQYQQSVT